MELDRLRRQEQLGEPGDYPVSVRFDDAATGRPLAGPFAKTLESAGLSALDLVFLAPVGEDAGLGRLGSLLAAWAEGLRPPDLPADAVLTLITDRGDPSVDDLALACRALRRLLAERATSTGATSRPRGTEDASSGFAELSTVERYLAGRVEMVRGRLATGLDGLGAALPAGDVRAAMLALAGSSSPAASRSRRPRGARGRGVRRCSSRSSRASQTTMPASSPRRPSGRASTPPPHAAPVRPAQGARGPPAAGGAAVRGDERH